MQRFSLFAITVVVCSLLASCLTISNRAVAEIVIYSNDFDGTEHTHAGVGVSISGGTATASGQTGGITSGQGFENIAGFGGDFWRVTANSDVLEFSFSNVPNQGLSYIPQADVEFSLAILDSWDGTSTTWGPDVLNIEILDGADQIAFMSQTVSGGVTPISNVDEVLVQNQQLGFNLGSQPWWFDDGYRMKFSSLPVSQGTLTFRIWASGDGFQGGNDESFAIDNLQVRMSTPEPASGMVFFATMTVLLGRRRRTASFL